MKRKSNSNYDNTVDGKELKKIKRLMFEINDDNDDENQIKHTNQSYRTTLNKSVKSNNESDISDNDSEVDFQPDDCGEMDDEDRLALQRFLNPEIVKDVMSGMSDAKKQISDQLGIEEADGFDWDSVEGINEHIEEIKTLMANYKKGRLFLKIVKVLPQLKNWYYIMEKLDFPSWSKSAIQLISQQFRAKGGEDIEIYFKHFLLPYVRANITENKRLDNALYKTLQDSLFRRREFMSGLLLPWCDDNITAREAEILGNVLKSSTIKLDVAAPAMTCLMNNLEYSREILIVLRAFLEKKYNLPFVTINTFVEFFYKAITFDKEMTLFWHQTLNLFVSLYYRSLNEEGIGKIYRLCRVHNHEKVTPSIKAFLKMNSASESMDMGK